jgi:GAF domain-containing protein
LSHVSTRYEFTDKPADYASLARELTSLLADEADLIANAANTAALIFEAVPRLNWVGFYFLKDGGLVVGPFQGRPACVRIAAGQGVCGAAVARKQTVLVDDVHAFPGHIACDVDSRSELVVPLLRDGAILGVLDLDSPLTGRFEAEDQVGVERIATLYVEACRG